ncbi:serine hydrolase domain-containing protein [Streptomyces acidicola]|uniref:serine hydrolase domain-containing protein n=1 Tax=Streptomyces acidicola TaxID=2596892 RepID=UPI00381006E1
MSVRTGLVVATALAAAVALAVPAAAAPAGGVRIGHSATREAMDAAVRDGVPGVTAQAKDAHGVWRATSGVGDLRTGTPRSTEDHYRVASITKTFVATVMLQLEADGELSLDDTVERWLPGVVRGHGHDGRKVKLRQLLNHTSGIFNVTEDKTYVERYSTKDGFFKHRYDTLTPDDLVGYAMKNEPDFTPGTSWNYSNTNYVLAGMVIEKVTGHWFGDEIDARIIKPLGLGATSVPRTDPTMPRPSSRAYSKLAQTATGPTYDVTEWNPTIAYGGGNMISDSADLSRFYTALVRGRLLPEKQQKELTATVETGDPDRRYGLGLTDVKLNCGVHVWGHGGDTKGTLAVAVTTADGRHSLAFNFNGDWSGDSDAVIEAEFCGK